jgi:hypothetical protein
MHDCELKGRPMFSLHRGSRTAGQGYAESRAHDLHHEPSTGPLDGELIDLYAAILIVVPLALLVKSLLF